ncbi:MAG: phosphatidate cytidylyltransferase [Comamonadaceae bacterium]|jgi:phosphatidate cytidylyltransferase|uniref:Phosphatidate cytidylyltransferase n=1 Tax=Hydrogenophaga borbori TaxID=2294117 RepID=A0A372EP18_9BURK|nr:MULTISPECIES: phosphatidate cytidylyltransferase [Hydrogenophaga]NCT99249.1 phosphatidate cytidylyltransferase [Comamonadaceae bacterium]RFP82383.1 phosphatidate cytidylyltransferase [Hydrogenophaga borbori]WQB81951.1 phosphatidate cytidylyltransferase [Hydrogenophaga sp. SNF1]
MLKQRVITALLLLAVFLPTLLYPSIEPFAAFTLVLIGTAGWEWARLNGCGQTRAVSAGLALGVAGLVFWLLGGVERPWPSLWLGLCGVWVLLALVLLRGGTEALTRCPLWIRLWLGLFLIACAWLALVQARLIGLGFLLSVLLLVWAADIAAYFGGKRFGRRKLAPRISPGKSWEGAISGLIGVLLLAGVWLVGTQRGWLAPGHLYDTLWSLGPALALVSLVFLTTMSVVGDLVESLVKRAAGVKDSSGLLPGHGGVLDRIDALLPVLPLAMMLVSF